MYYWLKNKTEDNVMAEKILLIEDSLSLAQTYIAYMRSGDYDVSHCASGAEAIDYLKNETPDIILLDLKLPDMNGMDIVDYINDNDIETTIVIITAHGSVEVAVEAMQAGAFDFLMKPFDAQRLLTTISKVLDHRKLQNLVDQYEQSLPKDGVGAFIGASRAMQIVYQMIRNAAPSDAAVFITGESGTGKELCAEAIHQKSRRSQKPFVAVNCGAIPRDLLESEIFGHKKGAFTGAIADRDGAAFVANGGTLFLDEIGELDIDLQVKLLRFIQTKTFKKVGEDKEIEVDIRFVCATNRDPLAQVQRGEFREDLYYRLNVIPINMPPLSERNDDVILLADHFMKLYAAQEKKEFSVIQPAAEELMMAYNWPGNVRELQNLVHQLVVLNDGTEITPDMLPEHITNQKVRPKPAKDKVKIAEVISMATEAEVPVTEEALRPLWTFEKEAIERTINACDGNVVKAAAYLEVSPSTVYRKLRNWGIEIDEAV